jgi:hypothetical protein
MLAPPTARMDLDWFAGLTAANGAIGPGAALLMG